MGLVADKPTPSRTSFSTMAIILSRHLIGRAVFAANIDRSLSHTSGYFKGHPGSFPSVCCAVETGRFFRSASDIFSRFCETETGYLSQEVRPSPSVIVFSVPPTKPSISRVLTYQLLQTYPRFFQKHTKLTKTMTFCQHADEQIKTFFFISWLNCSFKL